MSNDEPDEFAISESECPEWATDGEGVLRDCSSIIGPLQERESGNIIQCDSGRTDNVCVDQTDNKKKVAAPKRIDRVKRGRAAAKKYPKRNRPNRIRSRTFVGTLNNPTATDKQYYRTVSLDKMDWLVACEEVAPDTGTPHLQMACHFKTQIDIGQAQRVFGQSKSHLEIMKGTCQQSLAYCSKDKDKSSFFVERGVIPAEKGKASKMKLEAMVKAIQTGASDRSIFEANPFMYLRYA